MIVLTTPTGTIGRNVLRRLLDAGAGPLRVIVRDRKKLPAAASPALEIVEGSLDDAAVLRRAFAGARALFWCQPDAPEAPDYVNAYAERADRAAAAIRAAGLARVVAISAAGAAPGRPAGPITALHRVEAALAPTGAAARFLRCGSFFENLLWQWDSLVSDGVFTYAMDGGVASPQVATADIARLAADLLGRDDWAGVEPVPVLGPRDLSYREMAETLSRALRRPVRYEESAPADYRQALLAQGFTPSAAQGHLDMFAFLESGYRPDPAAPRANTPTTFEEWLDREA